MSSEIVTSGNVLNKSSENNEAQKGEDFSTNKMTRNTGFLEIPPANTEQIELARRQLENLSKNSRKNTKYASLDVVTDEVNVEYTEQFSIKELEEAPEIIYDGKPTMTNNLSSAIISKEELENEIRKKVAAQDPVKKEFLEGTIEIPQELILSEINAPCTSKSNEVPSQLDGQELIDILEGKTDDENEVFEVIGENGMFIVKDKNAEQGQTTSYEIFSPEDEILLTKQKLLEREIAIRQIASLPARKTKKSKSLGSPSTSAQQSLAQSLAMDWNDDKDEEVILELENVEETNGEPKIKILNMTILNESPDKQPKKINITKVNELPTKLPVKSEPKILNKNAPKSVAPPKILNINASSPAAFKRNRLVKKKIIYDPSATSITAATTSVEKKPQDKIPISLPPTITIKKLTKESIKSVARDASNEPQTPTRKGKKKSEIDRLFQDEGAVNMIYSLERQNNNQEVPELKVHVDQKSFVDKSEEKSALIAKAKTIKQTILKQSTSPPESIKTTSSRPQRVKRDLTPSKVETAPDVQAKSEKAVIVTKAQKSAPGRRKKADDSWDYVRNAQTTCDDAMIIRRHSSSSYSSSATSPRRLSLDQSLTEMDKSEEGMGFEFTKPQEKKSPNVQKDLKSCVGGLVDELRNTLSTKLSKVKVQAEKTPKGRKRAAATAGVASSPESLPSKRMSRTNGSEKEFQLTKMDGYAHIILSANPISMSILSEMKTLLGQLEFDNNIKAVLITAAEDFSKGLDYSTLVQSTNDKRKQAASDLVTALKNFLISLAAFPKVLVCGLKSEVSGIAVTMLPFFDIVVGDEACSFSLPHVLIGSLPEGISILQSSKKINSNAITELFYLNEKLNAKNALNYGLITKISSGNVDLQVKEICKKIALYSSQALESTKNILTEEFLSTIDQQLSKEVKILQQQWISGECQEKFKKYISLGHW